jgi:hypothetical protein
MVADAHDVITQEQSLVPRLYQKGLKGIASIDYPNWPGILFDNRNMYKTTLFHDR